MRPMPWPRPCAALACITRGDYLWYTIPKDTPMKQSEIRRDYIQEKYVIISPRRKARPHDITTPKTSCVFCPQNIVHAGKIVAAVRDTTEKKEPWAIRVIQNKFPTVSSTNKKVYGRQEVVVETPDHLKEIENLSDARVARILKVYIERTKEISRDKKINYILIFKNNGGAAGASLQHAHSQIFATAFVPPHLRDKSRRMEAHRIKHGECVYCDVIKKEMHGPRLIAYNAHVIAFCPFAPMHNYEVWIMPRRHLDNITQLTNDERLSFAKMLKRVLKKINALALPYNYYFHQVVHDTDQHLYMKITPRGSVWAGVEIGSGLIINPVSPEEAAKFYRN